MGINDSDYAQRMNAFHAAHRGAVQACIIHRTDVLALLLAAAAGNVDARIITDSIETWMRDAQHRDKANRFLCLDCETTFHQRRIPDAFLVVTPFATLSGHAIGTGICRRCANRDDDQLMAKAIDGVHKIYPDATIVEPGQLV
jgi:hypothetical protein